MASLTRWVLAHKRLVVVFWVLMTLVGIASAGPATKALTVEERKTLHALLLKLAQGLPPGMADDPHAFAEEPVPSLHPVD